MDSIASHLSPIQSRVAVPISVPGLVTRRVMAMTYMEGLPLMQLQDKVKHLPKWKRDKVTRGIGLKGACQGAGDCSNHVLGVDGVHSGTGT